MSAREELYEELLMSVVSDWKGMFNTSSADPGKVLGDYIRSKVVIAFDKPVRAASSAEERPWDVR